MKTSVFIKTILIIFLSIISTSIHSQISKQGTPPSIALNITNNIPSGVYQISKNWEQIRAEDDFTAKNKFPQRVGFSIKVDKKTNEVGKWEQLPDGRMLWQYKIDAPGAKSLGVILEDYKLPENAELYIYDTDKKFIIGAFTSDNNNSYNVLSTHVIPSSSIIIEYCEPRHEITGNNYYTDAFKIGEIIYMYNFGQQFTDKANRPDTGDSEWCEVNVNCSPEGDNWKKQKKGVGHIVLKEGNSWYVCSGTLINNTLNNGIPYFLSAYHCGGTASEKDKSVWEFYFNYEYSGCSENGTPVTNNMISGCEMLAYGEEKNKGTDFMLLKLKKSPPLEWNVYFNGWERSETGSMSGVSIHHPAGDVKKISTYKKQLTASTYDYSTMSGGHWKVNWSATSNGYGVTEGGSSGSPIFNTNGQVVGTLTGGGSYCTSPNGSDFYGRFDKHWNANGTIPEKQLAPWLDPNNSNTMTLQGLDPNNPISKPTADFKTDTPEQQAGFTLKFQDLSKNIPATWEWIFEGGTPATSNEQNPQVTYAEPGTYSVTLKVSNILGSDTKIKTDYISIIEYIGNDIAIGTGNNTSVYPLGSNSLYERSASIYLGSEIGKSGGITKLAWYSLANTTGKDIKIYLKNTSSSSFSESETWDNLISDAKLVFEGTVSTTANQWSEIKLDKSFDYSNTKRLIVMVEQNNSVSGNSKCTYTATTNNTHQHWDDNTIPLGKGTIDKKRPNLKITLYVNQLTPEIIINDKSVQYIGTPEVADITINPSDLVSTVYYKAAGTESWINEANQIGTFSVKVDVEGNGKYKSRSLTKENALIINNNLGIEQKSNNNIKIYPNPVTDGKITLESSENITITDIKIYDLKGQTVSFTKNNENSQLDVSQLSKGIYFIKITDSKDQHEIRKMIIK